MSEKILKLSSVLILFGLTACGPGGSGSSRDGSPVGEVNRAATNTAANGSPEDASATNGERAEDISFENGQADASDGQPTNAAERPETVRDYFMLLPEKYFPIDCCDGDKEAYLRQYLMVEDTANGYMDGGGDAAQNTFRMAIFKRPDGNYLIALNVFGEMRDDYYFLDYTDGKWEDVSARVVPAYSRDKIYDIPRRGTTVGVYEKRLLEGETDPNLTEKGKKLYDLIWQGGAFKIRK